MRTSSRRVGFWSEIETTGGQVTVGEQRVGRERAGGKRWRILERASAASDVDKRLLGCVDGVGGGAAVAPYMFDSCCCCLGVEDAMMRKPRKKEKIDTTIFRIYRDSVEED